jgi:hypothetical protein
MANYTHCKTDNVVYILSCNYCKKQYVGETKRSFIVRLKEHMRDVVKKIDSPVAKHFNLPGHSVDNIVPNIIEYFKLDPTTTQATRIRKDREKHWIHCLRTMEPQGINVQG